MMNWLDRVFEKSAVEFSQKFSRRKFIRRAASGAAAGSFLGILAKTLAAFLAAQQKALAADCEPLSNCGMGGEHCGFLDPPPAGCDCGKCVNPDGCPVGTARGGFWSACCPCLGDHSHGKIINYVDCCGGGIDRNKCPPKCYGRQGGTHGLACFTGSAQSWCLGTPGGPICTLVENSGTDCTPP